jgi:hypothetical protein
MRRPFASYQIRLITSRAQSLSRAPFLQRRERGGRASLPVSSRRAAGLSRSSGRSSRRKPVCRQSFRAARKLSSRRTGRRWHRPAEQRPPLMLRCAAECGTSALQRCDRQPAHRRRDRGVSPLFAADFVYLRNPKAEFLAAAVRVLAEQPHSLEVMPRLDHPAFQRIRVVGPLRRKCSRSPPNCGSNRRTLKRRTSAPARSR